MTVAVIPVENAGVDTAKQGINDECSLSNVPLNPDRKESPLNGCVEGKDKGDHDSNGSKAEESEGECIDDDDNLKHTYKTVDGNTEDDKGAVAKGEAVLASCDTMRRRTTGTSSARAKNEGRRMLVREERREMVPRE